MKWIDLETAAKRSGLSIGAIRRLCAEKWASMGQASLEQRAGRKASWHVREDADPRLSPVKFPEQMPFDSKTLSQAQRQTAFRRKRLLDRWESALKAGARLGKNARAVTQLFCLEVDVECGNQLSRSTLYDWRDRFRQSGMPGLVDGRGSKGDEAPSDDPFLEYVRELYLKPRKLKISSCHLMASVHAEEHGWEVRSPYQSRRYLDRIPRAVVLKMRHGDEAYTNEAEPYIERDYSTLASNEIWCGDHHQFDVKVTHQGRLLRPWLTAWMDMRSRKIVGWQALATDPNTDTILAAFREGVLAFGVPTEVYVDNGKDYDSYSLNGRTKRQRRLGAKPVLDKETAGGVFASLDVKARFCWKYHGQSKPIERFFGTLESHTPVWETYCGNSPANRPEDHELQIQRGNAPTLAEFAGWFGDWLKTYHATAHTGDSMNAKSPDQVFADNLLVKRTAPSDLLEMLMLKVSRPVKVGQNGVRHAGLNYGQYETALWALLGEEVVLRIDSKDISHVTIWTVKGKFICRAAANQRVPANATAEHLRTAIAAKKAHKKTTRNYIEQRPRLHEDLTDLIVRAKFAEARPAPAEPAPTLSEVQSPFKDQMPALRKAMEPRPMKRAAGAEHDAGEIDIFAATGDWDLQPKPWEEIDPAYDIFADGGADLLDAPSMTLAEMMRLAEANKAEAKLAIGAEDAAPEDGDE